MPHTGDTPQGQSDYNDYDNTQCESRLLLVRMGDPWMR